MRTFLICFCATAGVFAMLTFGLFAWSWAVDGITIPASGWTCLVFGPIDILFAFFFMEPME